MFETGPFEPWEFNKQEFFKKIELSKSDGPHYQLFLKHQSPIHHLKTAKDIEERNYVKMLNHFFAYKKDL